MYCLADADAMCTKVYIGKLMLHYPNAALPNEALPNELLPNAALGFLYKAMT